MNLHIRRIYLLLFCASALVAGTQSALAQVTTVVTGTLTDTASAPIAGASAAVIGKEGKILTGGITDSRGRFTIRAVPQGDLTLRIHSIGYDTVRRAMKVTGDTLRLGTLRLRQNAITTELVEVEAVQERGQQRGDTTEFNAKAFKTDANASADEMIRKMPGIEVENGQVRAQGENVRRVLVDGKPFFGDDPNTTLKNIPSDMIDKVQVYNQMSDQSQFTGFDDGDRSKTLNIVTREDRRKGQFGKIYAGYGGLDQVQDRYTAGGNVNFFNGDQRISVLALSNNINQQNFSIADILGTMGGGGGMMMRMAGAMGGSQAQMWMSRRGGGGGNSGGGDGGSNLQNFMVNNQDGITRSHGLGINYSDQFGKTFSMSGSYFFNNTDNTTLQSIKRQNFLAGTSTQLNDQSTDNNQGNTNHRLNLRAELQIDSLSSFLISPRLTWQSNDRTGLTATSTTALDTLLNQSDARNVSDNKGYNIGGDILYRKRFATQGRTFSANLSTTIRNNDASQENISENEFLINGQRLTQLFRQDIPSLGRNATYGANLNYTEPIAKSHQLQFGYNLSIQNSRSERQLFNFDTVSQRYSDLNVRLSNNSESQYIRHRPGVTYRFTLEPERDTTKPQANPGQMMSMFGMGGGSGGMRPPGGGMGGGMDMGNVGAWTFSVGADYQYATLGVTQSFPGAFESSRTFVNILPSLTITTRPSMMSNFRLSYRASTNQPSISQLQDVVDNTDPLRLSSGNPALNQEFTHNINVNYGMFNVVTAGGFFTNLSFDYTQDKIVYAQSIDSQFVRHYRPENTAADY
ncbi:MAG: outer membrane beta-barrel protein, partial [Candidatus Kapabacteria bacterium]|nr:outer membrane beta-barrel protein [Candidatus Kapabacteria bacterium]